MEDFASSYPSVLEVMEPAVDPHVGKRPPVVVAGPRFRLTCAVAVRPYVRHPGAKHPSSSLMRGQAHGWLLVSERMVKAY